MERKTNCFHLPETKPSEERYAATQLEYLGLMWSLEKLYYYPDGAHFEVHTDFQAIKALLTVKNPNRHIFRWQLAIQEHRGNMTVKLRSGVENKNADGLSRNVYQIPILIQHRTLPRMARVEMSTKYRY